MKYNRGKIKSEHGVLKEFTGFLKHIELLPSVQRIIPGRIKRSQRGTSAKLISYSYPTPSGLKFLMKKGGTVQELFITTSPEHQEHLITSILETSKRTL